MSKSQNTRSYPFFLGPAEHRLPTYYRRLNRLAFTLSSLIFLVNEFFVRPDLAVYKNAPETLWSIIALTLNAADTADHVMPLIASIVLYSVFLTINLLLLPKWGPRPTKVGMKSGVPHHTEVGIDVYPNAYFLISNPIQKFAFMCWHSVLMPVTAFFASFLPCMLINLLRNLS